MATRPRTAAPYRDSAGKSLQDYPRPSLAVDTALLTVAPGGPLSVLLTLTNGAVRGGAQEWRLPGTFLHPGETLEDAVLRSLKDKAGVTGLHPRQLHVFDAPGRDDRGWVVSVAHRDAVPAEHIPLIDRTRLVPVDQLPHLPYDHDRIVAAAAQALRADYERAPDPAGLLPRGQRANDDVAGNAFTLKELRELHELVLGHPIQRDNFRRAMAPNLQPTGLVHRGARGKPAELYRRSGPASTSGTA